MPYQELGLNLNPKLIRRATPLPTATPLPEGGYRLLIDRWKDQNYHPAVNSLIDSYTFWYDPATKGIIMETCFTGDPLARNPDDNIRIISHQDTEQDNSKVGYVYNHTRPLLEERCHDYRVIDGPEDTPQGEEDTIVIGEKHANEPHDTNYTGRTYHTRKIAGTNSIEVEYLGVRSIDPSSVVLRPDQPPEYYER